MTARSCFQKSRNHSVCDVLTLNSEPHQLPVGMGQMMNYRSLGLLLAFAVAACGERGASSPGNDVSPKAVGDNVIGESPRSSTQSDQSQEFVPDEPFDEDVDGSPPTTNSSPQELRISAESLRMVSSLSEQYVEAGLEGSLADVLGSEDAQFKLRRPHVGHPLRIEATLGLRTRTNMALHLKIRNVGSEPTNGFYRIACTAPTTNGPGMQKAVLVELNLDPGQVVYAPIFFENNPGAEASCSAPEHVPL